MTVASPELCKELYELSGWADTDEYWCDTLLSSIYVNDYILVDATDSGVIGDDDPPAYDLGYLLRKLPRTSITRADGKRKHIYYADSFGLRDANRRPEIFEADTPEDAAAKLAVELFKLGVLTREAA